MKTTLEGFLKRLGTEYDVTDLSIERAHGGYMLRNLAGSRNLAWKSSQAEMRNFLSGFTSGIEARDEGMSVDAKPAKPAPAPKPARSLWLLTAAQGTLETPAAHMQKICSGVENRIAYEVHLDAGGPNQKDPSVHDPVTLLLKVGGRRWKVKVADLATQLAGIRP